MQSIRNLYEENGKNFTEGYKSLHKWKSYYCKDISSFQTINLKQCQFKFQ